MLFPIGTTISMSVFNIIGSFYESMYEITAKEEGIPGRECHSHDSNQAEHENKKKRDNDSILKVPVLSFEKNRVVSSSTKSLFHIQMTENPCGSIRELIKLKFVFRRYGELVKDQSLHASEIPHQT